MNFKFNAKNIFLTYPNCPLSKETLLEKLQGLHTFQYYIVCEELHESGEPHLHAVLTFPKRYHTTNSRAFDVGHYHPHIKTLKTNTDRNQTVEYCKKDGNFKTNMPPPVMSRQELAAKIVEAGSITPEFIRENPTIIFLNETSVTKWLQRLNPPKRIQIQTLEKKRHYWLHGPSNSGKSYYLNAFQQLFCNPQEIPSNNDFAYIDVTVDLLYADEYKGTLTVQQLNRLCDGNTLLNTKGGSTRISYPIVFICSNYSIKDCYSKISDEIYDTLLNRFKVYELPLFKPAFPVSFIKKN